jgi:hypothetical protein
MHTQNFKHSLICGIWNLMTIMMMPMNIKNGIVTGKKSMESSDTRKKTEEKQIENQKHEMLERAKKEKLERRYL